MIRYLFIALLFAACSGEQMDDCITSAGQYGQLTRELDVFNKLVTNEKFRVILVEDTTYSVVVKGPENLLEQVECQIADSILELSNGNTCNFVRSFKDTIEIEVHCPDLRYLELNGASSVSSYDTFHLKRIHILHQALSDLNLLLDVQESIYVQSFNSSSTLLKGKATVLKGSVEGVSDLNADQLLCKEVLLDTHSPLDCYVTGTEILFVKIYNSGNVYYSREPSKYKDLNVRAGTGDLILKP